MQGGKTDEMVMGRKTRGKRANGEFRGSLRVEQGEKENVNVNPAMCTTAGQCSKKAGTRGNGGGRVEVQLRCDRIILYTI